MRWVLGLSPAVTWQSNSKRIQTWHTHGALPDYFYSNILHLSCFHIIAGNNYAYIPFFLGMFGLHELYMNKCIHIKHTKTFILTNLLYKEIFTKIHRKHNTQQHKWLSSIHFMVLGHAHTILEIILNYGILYSKTSLTTQNDNKLKWIHC